MKMEATGQSSDTVKGSTGLTTNWIWETGEKEELRIMKLQTLFSVPLRFLASNLLPTTH